MLLDVQKYASQVLLGKKCLHVYNDLLVFFNELDKMEHGKVSSTLQFLDPASLALL